jgi:hypothetical protein
MAEPRVDFDLSHYPPISSLCAIVVVHLLVLVVRALLVVTSIMEISTTSRARQFLLQSIGSFTNIVSNNASYSTVTTVDSFIGLA